MAWNPAHAGDWSYAPDQQAVFEAAVALGARPASADRAHVELLLIDEQKDFCFPQGSLYVGGRSGTGAVDDTRRLCAFIYGNLERISSITATLDTHHPFQIFFSSFWVDREGRHPAPHRAVTADEIASGALRPDPRIAFGDSADWVQKQALHYARALEKSGKYVLWLWPPHCILGSPGHALAGAIHEARLFHAWARGAPGFIEIKGEHAYSENYSVLSPEVLTHHDARAPLSRNEKLIDRLLAADRLIIAGQAASHCVKSSVEDLLESIQQRDPGLARKVFLLTDCMSAVAVPGGPDFTPQAEEALQRFAAAGMQLVRSTDFPW